MLKGVKKAGQYFNSISIKFVICTALITLVSVLTAGLFPFYYFNRNINQEIKQYNAQRLEYLRNMVDNRIFSQTLGVMYDFLYEKDLTDISYDYLQNREPVNYTAVAPIIKSMKSVVTLNADVITSVSAYFVKNQVILSSGEGIRYENDTGLKLPYDDEWISLFKQDRKGKNLLWLPTRSVPVYDRTNGTGQAISLVASYPGYNQDDVFFCLNIDERSIRRIMNEIAGENGINIMLVDQSGMIISDSDSSLIGTQVDGEIRGMLERKDSSTKQLGTDKKETVISLIKSDYTDWYYVLSVPSGFYFEKASLARRVVILICLIIFLVLITFAIVFSVKITYPFSRILNHIKSKLQTKEKSFPKNELLYLEDTLNGLYEKADLQEEILNGNRPLVLQTFLLSILSRQKLSKEAMQSTMSFLNIRWERPFFAAGILRRDFFISDKQEMQALDSLIGDNLNRNSPDLSVVSVPDSAGQTVLIFNFQSETPEPVILFMSRLSESIEEQFGVILPCSLGTVCRDIQDIACSYKEACSAILYSGLYVQTGVYLYSVTQQWDKNAGFHFRYIDELIKSMNEYRTDHCRQYLNMIMNSIINGRTSYKTYQRILGDIETAIESLAFNTKTDLSELFSVPVTEQIESQRYITDTFKRMESILTELIEYILQQHSNQNSFYASRAKQFINENYSRDISIQDIADQLHISRNHLCRVFKETNSSTLLNYITELRMEKAKELLLSGVLSVNEVAEKVGFNNATYFIKKFKQNFGVTPYQFKNNAPNDTDV